DVVVAAVQAEHLGDALHAPGAVAHAHQLDDDVQGRGHLHPSDVDRQRHVAHQAQGFQTDGGVARGVGVDGGQGAGVAGQHRLDQVQRLAAADLADDDAVGPHAQRVHEQVADGDLAVAVGPRRLGLEVDGVRLVELELGRVLDDDDALVVGDGGGQGV